MIYIYDNISYIINMIYSMIERRIKKTCPDSRVKYKYSGTYVHMIALVEM